MSVDVKPLGDNAILINFDQHISPDVLNHVLQLQHIIERNKIKGIKELVPAYASLAVFYDPLQLFYNDLKEQIINLSKQASGHAEVNKSTWKIPVCYDSTVAGDLQSFITHQDLNLNELISLHTGPEYLVYMRGFLPGFLYLGGLDNSLILERKTTPTAKVPEGSVAIGGQQTGIYSFPSPGGWHIIGCTPVKLFNKDEHDIMKVKPGDKINFSSISVEEFHSIKKKVKEGNYTLEELK
ncbi:MAG: 5-oxoprolinase subunit PxpB [Candidatus Cyclobacteriaceae bacterium M2_1C_046]